MKSRGFVRLLFYIMAFDILITSVKSTVELSLLELPVEEKTLFEPPFEDIVKGKLYDRLRNVYTVLLFHYYFISTSFIIINSLKLILFYLFV